MVEVDDVVGDLLDELIAKYLLNLPDDEYANEVQLCYAFQLAHWEYLDAPETEHLQHKLSFSNFVITVVDLAPELGLNKADVPKIVSMFNKQNWQIPVFGAMLINRSCDKVLLVQTLVKDKGGAWMFPRGKIEKRDHGSSFDCACREVYEETGFQMLGIAKDDAEHYVERKIQAGNETKVVGLYLVPGVDEQFEFFSLTQGEVYQFAWFRISDLMNQMKKEKPVYIDGKAAKFVQVHPFLVSLNSFANRLRKQQRGGQGAQAQAPAQQQQEAPTAWGFDEMLHLNQGLQVQQRPYDGVLPQNQKAQAGKQRKQRAGQHFSEAQEQAVQLAMEATQFLDQPLSAVVECEASTLQSESSSLSARRDSRRRGKRRSRVGGDTAKEQADAGVKDRRKRGGADGRANARAHAAGSVMCSLPEHWEPVQLTLPEIQWRGIQLWGTRSGTATAARVGTLHGAQCPTSFSLNKAPVIAALDAALRQRPVS